MTFQCNYESLLISLQDNQLFISEQLPLLLITVQFVSLLTTSQWVEWLIALHLPEVLLLIVSTVPAPPSNIDIPSFESWFKIRSGSFLTVAMILILLLPSYSFGHCSFSSMVWESFLSSRTILLLAVCVEDNVLTKLEEHVLQIRAMTALYLSSCTMIFRYSLSS